MIQEPFPTNEQRGPESAHTGRPRSPWQVTSEASLDTIAQGAAALNAIFIKDGAFKHGIYLDTPYWAAGQSRIRCGETDPA